MKLLELMQQCIDERRDMLISDGYNLYKLRYIEFNYLGDIKQNVLMYEFSLTLGTTRMVEVTYDILSNEYYYELV